MWWRQRKNRALLFFSSQLCASTREVEPMLLYCFPKLDRKAQICVVGMCVCAFDLWLSKVVAQTSVAPLGLIFIFIQPILLGRMTSSGTSLRTNKFIAARVILKFHIIVSAFSLGVTHTGMIFARLVVIFA